MGPLLLNSEKTLKLSVDMDENLKCALTFVAGCVTSYLVVNIVIPKVS